jgi:pyruvate/2-oxoglutarate/acetoin dehydrogenase E1 component
MVIENKILYTIDTAKKTLPSYSYKFDSKKFPDLIISPVQDEPIVTIICYGEVLNEVEDAAFELLVENDIYVEIICPSLISSFYVENIVSSLSKTRRLIVVEEGSGIASWGSEIISELVATGREDLSITRLSNNLMIPSSFKAEISQIPEKFKIKNHIIKLISNV